MKLRIIYNSRLVRKGYYAWVLYPFMFFRDDRDVVTDERFRHEMQHVYQVMRDGWWVFYAKYLWYLWKRGYLDNPYEIEARKAETQPLTVVERFFKDA